MSKSSPAPGIETPLAGSSAEDYEFSETLYESSRTVVYRGVHRAFKIPIIAKVLRNPHPSRQEMQAFEQEFQLISQFRDEGIVSHFTLIDFRTTKAIIMADDRSQSLSRFLKENTLTLAEQLGIARTIAGIISTIHDQGIVIRDIKPDNFVINTAKRLVKVIDFGLATNVLREVQEAVNPDRLSGTLSYLSPEQTGRMNRSVDFRSDFYSFGVTLYELFTGTLPFNFDDPLSMVHAHIALQAVPPHERDTRVPPAVSAVILKLMAKAPESRYQSGRGIISDLTFLETAAKTGLPTADFVPGSADVVETFNIPEKLYGREAEQQILFEEFERAASGDMRLLILSGPPGIGKSFLINELQKPLTQRRGYFFAGKFDQHKREIPYSAFIQALNQSVRQLLTEPEDRLTRMKARLGEHLGDNAWLLAELAPEWQMVLGECPAISDLTPQEIRNRFNAAIAGTIMAFTSRMHPVVLFLDDLQWADQASIILLQYLMKNMNLRHFLLIGAYRSEETNAMHPLSIMFQKLRSDNVSWWREYAMPPLPEHAVRAILDDALGADTKQLDELAAVISERTGGNPFFVKEFLLNLHERELIRFAKGWKLDLAGIREISLSSNILGLLVDRIERLDRITLEILKQMSAIGISTETELLQHRLGCSEEHLLTMIAPAIGEGLVIKQGMGLRFTHDRIHEAVYSLLKDDERLEAHHAIGEFLLQRASGNELRDRLFEIVHQLNLGLAAERDPKRLRRIAELNIQAGTRAKASSAYDSALAYFRVAEALIDQSCWQSDYPLMLAFQTDFSQTEYLCGANDEAEKRFDLILRHARDNMDKVHIFQAKMTYLIAVFRLEEAFHVGLDALKLLGIRLPRKHSMLRIVTRLLATQLRLHFLDIEKLRELPPLKSGRDLAIMKLFMALTEPVYHTNPDYQPILVLAMLNFTLKQGNSDYAAYAYAIFSIMTGSILFNIKMGKRIGELATSLVDQSDSNYLKGKVHFLNASMSRGWTGHLRDTIPELIDSYKYCLEAGDILWAAYSLENNLFYTFLKGDALDLVTEKFAKNRNQMRKLDQPIAWQCYDLWYQLTVNLMSETPVASLSGEFFSEAETIPGWQTSQDKTGLGYYELCKLIQCWFLGDLPGARAASDGTRPYLDAMVGMVFVAVWYFFDSLVLLAEIGAGAHRKARNLARVAANQRRLKLWADNAPENFQHKYLLIEALYQGQRGRVDATTLIFDRALVQARKNGYLQDAALICELAGEFFLRHQAENLASSYLSEAWHSYKLWNGNYKANQVMERYRQLIQTNFTYDSSPASIAMPKGSASLGMSLSKGSSGSGSGSGKTSSGGSQLDMVAIMKSANALTGEIDQEKLYSSMMRILMESAGAQRGVLLLRQGESLQIAAIGETTSSIKVQLVNAPFRSYAEMDHSIITFVERTRRPVVYDPGDTNELFTASAYFQEKCPSSVLCLPIINQSKLQGILYLENRVTAAIFTPQHLETLQLLSAQIGIALENAHLFQEQKRLTEVYSRYVPMEFLKLLGKESILDVKLADQVNRDMTIMFTDIRSFTSLSEQMTPAENFNFLNSYLAQVSPVVRANHGFIDKYLGDGLMALFPGSELDAIQAAVGIQRTLHGYNQGRQLSGYVPISVGIGVHCGSLMLGTIGEHERMETTVISDSVNIASRLESLSKRYGVNILISEQVVEKTSTSGRYKSRFLDRVVLVGKNKPLAIYEIIDGTMPEEFKLKTETLSQYNEGIEWFYKRDFQKAEACFDAVIRKNPSDNPARLYLDRCSIFTVNPPPDGWTGVVVLVDK